MDYDIKFCEGNCTLIIDIILSMLTIIYKKSKSCTIANTQSILLPYRLVCLLYLLCFSDVFGNENTACDYAYICTYRSTFVLIQTN